MFHQARHILYRTPLRIFLSPVMRYQMRMFFQRKRVWMVPLSVSLVVVTFFLFIHSEGPRKHVPNLIHSLGDSVQRVESVTRKDLKSNHCSETRHVIFVRLPKVGSSTTTFILWKFGLERNLKFLLPRYNVTSQSGFVEARAHYVPDPGKFCDMAAVVVMYNSNNIRGYFPADVVVVAQLREPMSHLYSTVFYFKYISDKIPGSSTEKLSTFLKNPLRYEGQFTNGRSLTQNPMSIFLGMKKEKATDSKQIQNFVSEIDKELDFVIILERYDESLLLLRRKFCWPLKSILYKAQNVNPSKPLLNATEAEYALLREWSQADYALYDHYVNKLEASVKELGHLFSEELDHFRSVLKQFDQYCSRLQSRLHSLDVLKIPTSRFSEEFYIAPQHCRFMETDGPVLNREIWKKHRKTNFCNR